MMSNVWYVKECLKNGVNGVTIADLMQETSVGNTLNLRPHPPIAE